MPENLQPESMQSWMRSVERRLAAVERPARLSTVQYGFVEPVGEMLGQMFTDSPTFVGLWRIPLSLIVADVFTVRFKVILFTTVSGQVRLRAPNVTGAPTTTALSLPNGTTGFVQFDWQIPGVNVGDQGVIVEIDANTTGGGSFMMAVESPTVLMQRPSYEIETSGVSTAQMQAGNGRLL